MGVEEWSGLLDGQWVVYGSPVQKCCGLGARGVGAHGLGSRVPFKVGMARVVKSGRGKYAMHWSGTREQQVGCGVP